MSYGPGSYTADAERIAAWNSSRYAVKQKAASAARASGQDLQRVNYVAGIMADWYPWLSASLAHSAALYGLDPSGEQSRMLASLAAADRLGQPTGMRGPGGRVRPREERFAALIHEAWDEALQFQAESGYTNAQMVQQAYATARARMETGQRPTIQGFGGPDQAITSSVTPEGLSGNQQEPYARGAAAAQLSDVVAYEQADVARLRNRAGLAPGAPVQSRRLVERINGLRQGTEQLTAGERERLIDVPSVEAQHQTQTAPPAQYSPEALVADRDAFMAQMEDRYGSTIPTDEWSQADRDMWTEARNMPTAVPYSNSLQTMGNSLNPLTPTIRAAGIALNAPLQGVQAAYRNFVGAWSEGGVASAFGTAFNPFGIESIAQQTDLGQIGMQIAEDPSEWLRSVRSDTKTQNEIDMGGGYFLDPDSEIAQRRYREEIEQGNVGGHVITIGRHVTDQLTPFRPDTLPFDVMSGVIDAYVAMKEPSNFVLDALSARMAVRAGLVRSNQRTIAADIAEGWRNTDEAADVFRHYADIDIDDTASIYRTWIDSGRQIPMTVLREMVGGARGDINYVSEVFGRHLGLDLRVVPRTKPSAIRRGMAESRLWNMMPSSGIRITNPNSAILDVERALRNANVADDVVADFVVRAGGLYKPRDITDPMGAPIPSLIVDPDNNEWFRFAEDMANEIAGHAMRTAGISDTAAARLTTFWSKRHTDEFYGWVDDVGDGRRIRLTTVDGQPVTNVGPHLPSEHLNTFIPMPDPRSIRRLTTEIPGVRAMMRLDEAGNPHGPFNWSVSALDFVQNEIWKPSVLLRLAWPIRVIGEEQLRMAAAGFDSAFHHPLSYISWAIGRKGADDVFQSPMNEVDQLKQALNHGSGGWLDSVGWRRTGEWRPFRQDQPEFDRAWATELAKLHADNLSRAVARVGTDAPGAHATMDDLIEDLMTGSMSQMRKDVTRGWAELDQRRVAGMASYAERAAQGDTAIRSLDDWVESIRMRIDEATGGQDELLDAIRTGRMRGIQIDRPGTARLEQKFVNELAGLRHVAPQAVAGPVMEQANNSRWAQVVESMFSTLMSRPTNYLSRSPHFRQAYWNRMGELAPWMDSKSLDEAIDGARAAGVDIGPFRRAAGRTTDRSVTLEEADWIAKGHALDDTRHLLYDLSERSQFFDAARLVFPFGEAWKEVITRWAEIIPTNLRAPRRAQQFIEEMRSNTAINEHAPGPNTAPEGAGFFWTNQWDEEVFVYPGSGWVTDRLVGVPVPLVGRAQGLSLATEIIPGFGLAVQIPAGFLFETYPRWADARIPGGPTMQELFIPFGNRGSMWGDLAPPAWRSAQLGASGLHDVPILGFFAQAAEWIDNSPEGDRAWAGTVADLARYLASTGEYPADDPRAQARLWQEAARRAPILYFIRAAGQFALPSSPAPDFVVEDTEGDIVRMAAAVEDWQRILQENQSDYYAATEEFMDRWGEDNHLIMQAKTAEITLNVPLSAEGDEWRRAHGGVVEDYPDVFGFFAPQGDPEDFSGRAWNWALSNGHRESFSTEEMARLDQNRLATMEYREAERRWVEAATEAAIRRGDIEEGEVAGIPDEGVDFLRDLREDLKRRYPGYGDFVGMTTRVDASAREAMIGRPGDEDSDYMAGPGQLRRAVEDDRLDEDTREGLATLLEEWDAVNALASSEAGGSLANFYTSASMQSFRDYFRYDLAPRLTHDNPQLAGIWTFIFDPLLDQEETV